MMDMDINGENLVTVLINIHMVLCEMHVNHSEKHSRYNVIVVVFTFRMVGKALINGLVLQNQVAAGQSPMKNIP